MGRIISISIIGFMMLILGACSNNNETKKEADYQETKKMVVDILQTEDGKKALSEILADEKMKEKLVIDSDVVNKSITDVLGSEKGKEMWVTLFNDPSFVKKYAESMSEEQEKLMKKLMNDSDFQKQMLDLLENPSVNDQMLTVLKSQEFRSHLEDVIQETLETPLFQEKIATLLLQAADEKNKKEKQEDKGKEGDKQKEKSDESGGGDKKSGEEGM